MMTDDLKPSPVFSSPLRVLGLKKEYAVRRTHWGKPHRILAVNGIHFEIPAGATLALVGRSGSGKSAVARCVTRLERPDGGHIWLDGTDIATLRARDLRPFRSGIQMVFQDASTSLNPRFTAREVIEEPMIIVAQYKAQERQERARALMKEVGLSPDWADRLAADFSGGQKQRLAIARALAVKPKLLVLDEALSGLDLSTQAHIANLLLELQASRALTYLLISHDLRFVANIAHFVAVMSEGRIVEQGPTQRIVSTPSHASTRALLASAQTSAQNLRQALGASS